MDSSVGEGKPRHIHLDEIGDIVKKATLKVPRINGHIYEEADASGGGERALSGAWQVEICRLYLSQWETNVMVWYGK